MAKVESNKHSRFADGTKHHGGRPMELAEDHKAVVEGRTLFRKSVRPADGHDLLKSGHNSSKVGAMVDKGHWRGLPIYTLSLEERATCPHSCKEWRICYGNHMPYAHRYEHGPKLEARLTYEIDRLNLRHRAGFVVRLHILGDFYSPEYVRLWDGFLRRIEGLRVFGYTARQADEPIGIEIERTKQYHGDHFSIRRSGEMAITIPGPLQKPDGAIICPAQTGQSPYCATCTLCWSAPSKVIAFMAH